MARNIMSVFNQRQGGIQSLDHVFNTPQMPQAQEPSHATIGDSLDVGPRGCMKLGKTLVFNGELEVGEDVLLLGRVEGSFTHKESLTVGPGGIIVGDVSGRTIIIKGTVEGDIEATESIVVAPGAVVTGDISSPRINVIEGAQFNGSVKMLPATTTASKSSNLVFDGHLTEEAVDQLLHMLHDRKKA